MKNKGFAIITFAIVVLIFSLWQNRGGENYGSYNQSQPISNKNISISIYDKVAQDEVEKYIIVARQGDRMQMYVQAGMCCAAFLQAKDEANYMKWKEIEKNLGTQVGIKQY